MFKLHYAPRTISIAPAIVLEEAGLPYDPVLVDFSAAEQTKPAYHQINPKGRVPALETPDGVLTETGAILEYIAPDMVPDNALAAARMRELMYYLASTMHVNHAHGARGNRWADDPNAIQDMKRKVPATMAASCDYLEEFLPQLPFWGADGMIVSDAYLYVVLTWLPGDGVDVSRYPNLAAFQHRMNTRRSVQRVYELGML
ncbi:glutathione S-transferase family protein [Yoonia sp.]|uniref:glutathione S-transferase family protein n=1 Tax=Yoonia sp. TaxID=2212373 RepID=UPI001A0798B6|nr:glutathione S-transferase family protein [Yoonia sp.]MBE0413688.1 glutathione S-transferase family protein [Yoonia sp.]